MNKELKEICSKCEDYIHCLGKGCAWRSLGNEYCDEVENVNKLIIELQNDLDASNSRAKELSGRIIKAIEYIDKHIRLDDEYPAYMEMLIEERDELLKILKGEPNNE